MFGFSNKDKCVAVCLEGIRMGKWFGHEGDLVGFVINKGFDLATIKKAMILAIEQNYKHNPGQMKDLIIIAERELGKL